MTAPASAIPKSAITAALEAHRISIGEAFPHGPETPDGFREVRVKLGAFRASDLARFSIGTPACLVHAVEIQTISRLGDKRIGVDWRWLAVLLHEEDEREAAAAAAERFAWWVAEVRPGPGLSMPHSVRARAFGPQSKEEAEEEATRGVCLWGIRWDQSVRYGAKPGPGGAIPGSLHSSFDGAAPRLIYGGGSS